MSCALPIQRVQQPSRSVHFHSSAVMLSRESVQETAGTPGEPRHQNAVTEARMLAGSRKRQHTLTAPSSLACRAENLAVRFDTSKASFFVSGLSYGKCPSEEELLKLYMKVLFRPLFLFHNHNTASDPAFARYQALRNRSVAGSTRYRPMPLLHHAQY